MKLLRSRTLLASALLGLAYGLICRLVFIVEEDRAWLPVMSIAFLMLVPLAMGFVTSYSAERSGRHGPAVWFGLPAVNTLVIVASSFLLFWEGIICLTMFLPIALLMSLVGGAIGAFCARRWGKTPLACIIILPFVTAPAEQWVGPAVDVREVHTAIVIHAEPDIVWEHIKRVAPIQRNEEQFSWTQAIGFPRPIEATLSRDGVGAIRHATFAGGVLFVETVTAFEPGKRLAFDIRADTEHVPARTLDRHVTIGGAYFDTLEGEYRIERLADKEVLLHLTSRHRLSTTFNFYGAIWTDAVMRDIQLNILHVIRGRCERSGWVAKSYKTP